MQYGSIGWSVGATLGYAQAVPNKRVISCIGDGSFQVRHPWLEFRPLCIHSLGAHGLIFAHLITCSKMIVNDCS